MIEVTQAVVGNSSRRRGRPTKVVDLTSVIARLRRQESLRHVAKSLGVSHSTLQEHLKRSGLMGGLDY